MKLGKGDKVRFHVRRGEHNLLAGRPGEVTGRRGRPLVVRMHQEVGTVFSGQEYLVPGGEPAEDLALPARNKEQR